jgi:hypothetical protein
MPSGTNFSVTYSNPFYLSNEGLIYNIVRSNSGNPTTSNHLEIGHGVRSQARSMGVSTLVHPSYEEEDI